MLDRLGARPVVGGNDEQRRIDLAGADQHVAHQPVMAGDIDEVELGAIRQRQMRVADIDRHPASPFLGEPIRVDPGERSKQGGLAVIDVPGRPDDDGHPRAARPMARISAVPSAASSAGSIVRRSSNSPSSWIRAMTGG